MLSFVTLLLLSTRPQPLSLELAKIAQCHQESWGHFFPSLAYLIASLPPTPIVPSEMFLNATETRMLYSLAYSLCYCTLNILSFCWPWCSSIALRRTLLSAATWPSGTHDCRLNLGSLTWVIRSSCPVCRLKQGMSCIAHPEWKYEQLNKEVPISSVWATFLRRNGKF